MSGRTRLPGTERPNQVLTIQTPDGRVVFMPWRLKRDPSQQEIARYVAANPPAGTPPPPRQRRTLADELATPARTLQDVIRETDPNRPAPPAPTTPQPRRAGAQGAAQPPQPPVPPVPPLSPLGQRTALGREARRRRDVALAHGDFATAGSYAASPDAHADPVFAARARDARRFQERRPESEGWVQDPATGAMHQTETEEQTAIRQAGIVPSRAEWRVGPATGGPGMGQGQATAVGVDRAFEGAQRIARGGYRAVGEVLDAATGSPVRVLLRADVERIHGPRPEEPGEAQRRWDAAYEEGLDFYQTFYGQAGTTIAGVGGLAAGMGGLRGMNLPTPWGAPGAERLVSAGHRALIADQFGQGIAEGGLELVNPYATPEERLGGLFVSVLTIAPEAATIWYARNLRTQALPSVVDALEQRGLTEQARALRQAEGTPDHAPRLEESKEVVVEHDRVYGADAEDPEAFYAIQEAVGQYAAVLRQANPDLSEADALSQAQAHAMLEYTRARARLWGEGGRFARDVPLASGERPAFTDAGAWSRYAAQRTGFGPVPQGARGMYHTGTDFATLSADADFTTLAHESFHRFRHYLRPEDSRRLLRWASGNRTLNDWTQLTGRELAAAEEKAALGWERYLATGRAPNPAVRDAFAWMRVLVEEEYGAGEAPGAPLPGHISRTFATTLAPGTPYAQTTVFGERAAATRAASPDEAARTEANRQEWAAGEAGQPAPAVSPEWLEELQARHAGDPEGFVRGLLEMLGGAQRLAAQATTREARDQAEWLLRTVRNALANAQSPAPEPRPGVAIRRARFSPGRASPGAPVAPEPAPAPVAVAVAEPAPAPAAPVAAVAPEPRAPEPEPAPEPVPEPEPAPRVDEPEPPALADPTPARVVPTDESEIVYIDPDAIQVHPDMQHRVDVDRRTGVKAENVAGRKTFLADQAGVLTVWRRLDGALFVADGHHRLQIAKNAEVFARRGPGGELVPAPRAVPVRILEEADGWTARQAADDAFLRNAVGGTSDAVETATAMRNMGMTPASLRASEGTRLPLAIEHHVQGLLGLRGELFEEFVGNRVVDFRAAAGIGRVPGASEQAQRGALSDAARANITTEADGESLARRWAQADAARGEAGRGGLFDEADLPPFAEMTQIEGRIASSIGSDVGRTARDAKVRIREGESLDAAARRAEALALGGTGAEASRLVRRAFATDAALNAELATLASEVRDGRRSVQSAAGALDARTREAVRRGSGQDVGGAEAGAAVGGPVGPGLRPEEGQDQASTLMQGPRRRRAAPEPRAAEAADPDAPRAVQDADPDTPAPRAVQEADQEAFPPAPKSHADEVTEAMRAAARIGDANPGMKAREIEALIAKELPHMNRRQRRSLGAYARRHAQGRYTWDAEAKTLRAQAALRHQGPPKIDIMGIWDHLVKFFTDDARSAGAVRRMMEDATGVKYEGTAADFGDAVNRMRVSDTLLREGIEDGFRNAQGVVDVPGLGRIENSLSDAGIKLEEMEEALRARREIALSSRDGSPISFDRAVEQARRLAEWESELTPAQRQVYDKARADIQAWGRRLLDIQEQAELQPVGWAQSIEDGNPDYWPMVPRQTAAEIALGDVAPERAAGANLMATVRAVGGAEPESGFLTLRRKAESVLRVVQAKRILHPVLDEVSQIPVLNDIVERLETRQPKPKAQEGHPFDAATADEPLAALFFGPSGRSTAPATVSIPHKGTHIVYKVEPYLWDTIRHGQPQARHAATTIMRMLAMTFRQMTTGVFNVMFSLFVGPLLDIASAMIAHGLNPFNLPRGGLAAMTGGDDESLVAKRLGTYYSQLYREAREAGAISQHAPYRDSVPDELLYDPNSWNPLRRAATTPNMRRVANQATWVQRVAETPMRVLEQGVRLTFYEQVYRAMVKKGVPHEEASRIAGRRARDLMNFQERGLIGAFLSDRVGVPYAAVPGQALMTVARGVKRDPAKFAARALLYITVPKMVEYATYHDDPEYRRLPDHVLDGGFVWKVGDQWYTARFPIEVGLVFWGVPRRTMEMAKGRMLPEEAVSTTVRQVLSQAAPPVVGPAIGAGMQTLSFLRTGAVLDPSFGRIVEHPIPAHTGRTGDPAALARALAGTLGGTVGRNVGRGVGGEEVDWLGQLTPNLGPVRHEPTGQARAWLRRSGVGWGRTTPQTVQEGGVPRLETDAEMQERVLAETAVLNAAVPVVVADPRFKSADAEGRRRMLRTVLEASKELGSAAHRRGSTAYSTQAAHAARRSLNRR